MTFSFNCPYTSSPPTSANRHIFGPPGAKAIPTPDWQAPQFNSYSDDFFGVFQEICLGGAGVHFRRRIQERETATTSKVAGRVRPLRIKRTKAVSKMVRLVHLTLKITTEAGSFDSLNKKRLNSDSPMNAKKRSGTAPSPLRPADNLA